MRIPDGFENSGEQELLRAMEQIRVYLAGQRLQAADEEEEDDDDDGEDDDEDDDDEDDDKDLDDE